MRAQVLVLVGLAVLSGGVRGQLSLEVNAALGRAVTRLLAAQRVDGSFGPLEEAAPGATAGYPVGTTALAVYALRKSGVAHDDPAIVSALSWLSDKPFEKTYSVAGLVLALDAHREPGVEATIRAAAEWLVAQHDANTGLWAYPHGEAELSNTQFAVLALRAAALHGHETPPRLWADIVEGAVQRQRKDGGFFYRGNYWPEPSGSMTTAGLTVLYVSLAALEAAERHDAEQQRARQAIARGWDWLDARFGATGGPMGHAGVIADRYPAFGRSDHHHYYYLYGMERIATFGDRDAVGGMPWYPAIAMEMLGHESPDGGWGTLENTCFAMLALRRVTVSGARDPVTALEADPAASEPAIGSGAQAAGAVTWAYTTEEPGKRWTEPGFDDSRWSRGEGGFAGGGATGLVVGTAWETTDLWVRRSFSWSPRDGEPRLYVIHDDSVRIWINGELAAASPVWSQGRYAEYALQRNARHALRRGTNVLAAWVHDAGGGRSLDIRFSPPQGRVDVSRHWLASLPGPDVPFVRRWELLGPLADEDHEGLLVASQAEAVVEGRRSRGKGWQAVRSAGSRLVIDEALGSEPGELVQASVWLHAPGAAEANLWLGASDGVRGWLDGRLVLLHHEHGAARADELRVPIELRAGAQRLVLLVEQQGPVCELFARVAARDGQAIEGLRYALSDELPDGPGDALAHPEAYAPAELLRRLPATAASSLRFDRASDLDALAWEGLGADGPGWIDKVTDKRVDPRPAARLRGVLGLQPASAARPAQLIARVSLPQRARALRARVALARDAEHGGQLELVVHEGDEPMVVATEVVPGSASGHDDIVELPLALARDGRRDVLLIVSWSALEGLDPEPLFVDEIALR